MIKKITAFFLSAVIITGCVFNIVSAANVSYETSEVKIEENEKEKLNVKKEINKTYELYKTNVPALTEYEQILAVISVKKEIKKADFKLEIPLPEKINMKSESAIADLLLSVLASGGSVIDYHTMNIPNELMALQKEDGSFGNVDSHLKSMAALNASAAEYDKESATSFLLSKQNGDGSFGYSDGKKNIEATAMAVTVLSDQLNDTRIKETVAKAVEYIKSVQLPNGGFEAYGSIDNSRTLAIVISSLLDAGEDLDDPKWNNIKDSLLRFKNPDGSYRYSVSDEAVFNEYAHTKVMQALGDIKKEKSIYKRLGIFLVGGNNNSVLMQTGLLCGAIILAGILFFIINKRRRKI